MEMIKSWRAKGGSWPQVDKGALSGASPGGPCVLPSHRRSVLGLTGTRPPRSQEVQQLLKEPGEGLSCPTGFDYNKVKISCFHEL